MAIEEEDEVLLLLFTRLFGGEFPRDDRLLLEFEFVGGLPETTPGETGFLPGEFTGVFERNGIFDPLNLEGELMLP